jgi:DedD protein
MRLPFLRAKDTAAQRPRAAAGAEGGASIEAARTRARRRLIGALVLLAIGVIGFPILFETQPRPLPLDIAIETPHADPAVAAHPPPPAAAKAVPLALPPADAGIESVPVAAAASAASAVPAQPSAPVGPASVSGPAVRAARPVAPASAPAARASASAVPAPRPDDGKRALALLAGEPAATATAGRYVVQVGAYADAAVLREARMKVERLGLKTYTQVIDGDGGKRTRVRVGPFATKEEAGAAAGRIKGAGLPTVVLVL